MDQKLRDVLDRSRAVGLKFNSKKVKLRTKADVQGPISQLAQNDIVSLCVRNYNKMPLTAFSLL